MAKSKAGGTQSVPQNPLKPMQGNEIRQAFLDFFAAKGHQILPSASLVPEDPTVLLTIAGMLPFKPIFLGQRPSEFPRATTSQKCIRTNDIENVGCTARHHTFFEMLGNFSFGDYFKPEAIAWAWELMTQIYGLPAERLVVSVFTDDDDAFEIWQTKIGLPPQRIRRMGADSNFWAAGPTGPCGPCSEIYFDFHPELGEADIDLDDDSRFLELYNLVFMQYNRDTANNLTPLQNQNIDTGMGLERMAQVLQGVPNNYETDLILPIIQTAAQIADIDYAKAKPDQQVSLKVIGDHVRAVMHMIADGITASNVGRGYVLRRLIRRVVRHGRLIGINRAFTTDVLETAISLAETAYPTLREQADPIKAELEREEANFLKTLDRGEKLLAEILARKPKQIAGTDAFELYDTYGFPLELTQEIAAEQGLEVDVAEFEAEMEQQRQRARSAHETIDVTIQGALDKLAEHLHSTEFLGYSQASSSTTLSALLVAGSNVDTANAGTEVQIILDKTPFYAESGGQIGDQGYLASETALVRITDVQKESGLFIHIGRIERGSLTVGEPLTAQIDLACRRRVQAHHTATHLLQTALKKLVDANISQAGSLVAFDRLRFDFNFNRALTPAEVSQIEDQINTWIAEAHPATTTVLPIAEAKARGAIAMFGEKYGDEVRVVDMPGVSMELCGGTHVSNTAEIGLLKVITEVGVASGIRRIEAVAGPAVLEYLNLRDQVVRDLSDRFKVKPEEISERVTGLQTELKQTQKQLDSLKAELALLKSDSLLAKAKPAGAYKLIIAQLDGVDAESLKTAAERLLQKLGQGAVVLASVLAADKVNLVAAFSPEVVQTGVQAGKFIGEVAKQCGGGGGGRPNLAQAGGKDATQVAAALQEAEQKLLAALGA
jgi:alanyl-tRNA synthetase